MWLRWREVNMYDIGNMPGIIEIGYTGENEFRELEFDMRPWLQILPDGVASIIHVRPGETAQNAYVAVTTMENGILKWKPSVSDVGTVEGYGQMQIWLEEFGDEDIPRRGKSAKCQTFVRLAVNEASEVVPPPQEAWIEQMTGLKGETVNAAAEAAESASAAEDALHFAPRIGESGNWIIWDAALGEWVDTEVPAQGPAGARGEAGSPGDPGLQGPPGKDGLNGVITRVHTSEFGFEIDENGHLILEYAEGMGERPNFSINSSGHLIYTYDD